MSHRPHRRTRAGTAIRAHFTLCNRAHDLAAGAAAGGRHHGLVLNVRLPGQNVPRSATAQRSGLRAISAAETSGDRSERVKNVVSAHRVVDVGGRRERSRSGPGRPL